MAMYHRVGFTAARSAELWERWKKGEGLKSIGRAFGKPSSCIFAHLRPSGGIMPPARRRSRLALTMAEREEISRGIVEGQSVRAIARETQTVVDALIRQARKLPDELYRSLTWDRGKELADHKRFSMETDIDVYFCDPQSPWQRGSSENTNRLLRQYFPKGLDLAGHSQAELNKVARQLNERPRKTLDFQSPAERFNQCVAATR